MKWIVAAVGLILAIGGMMSIEQGITIIQVERGWTGVIAGTVALSAGFVVMALSAVVAQLETISHQLAYPVDSIHAVEKPEEVAAVVEDAVEEAPRKRKLFRSLRKNLEKSVERGARDDSDHLPPPPREVLVESLAGPELPRDDEPDAPVPAAVRGAQRPSLASIWADRPAVPGRSAPAESDSDAAAAARRPSTLSLRHDDPNRVPKTLRDFQFKFPPLAPALRTESAEKAEEPSPPDEAPVALRGSFADETAATRVPAPELEMPAWDEPEHRQDEQRHEEPAQPMQDEPVDAEPPTLDVADEPQAHEPQTDEPPVDVSPVEMPAPAPLVAEAPAQAEPARSTSLFARLRNRRDEKPAPRAPQPEPIQDNLVDLAALQQERAAARPEPEAEDRASELAMQMEPEAATAADEPDKDWLERALSGVDEPPPARAYMPRIAERAAAPPPPPVVVPVSPPAIVAPSVVGRYEAQGTSYVMFSDGSIEAETDGRSFRFASLAELKSFIEKRA